MVSRSLRCLSRIMRNFIHSSFLSHACDIDEEDHFIYELHTHAFVPHTSSWLYPMLIPSIFARISSNLSSKGCSVAGSEARKAGVEV